MKYIELKNLARNVFPCKIFQGKNCLARSFKENISLQDLARNKFPCKILQVIAFLQGSCKILARNAFFLDQGENGIEGRFANHSTVSIDTQLNQLFLFQGKLKNWNLSKCC